MPVRGHLHITHADPHKGMQSSMHACIARNTTAGSFDERHPGLTQQYVKNIFVSGQRKTPCRRLLYTWMAHQKWTPRQSMQQVSLKFDIC